MVSHYEVDFLIKELNGTWRIDESKGHQTPEWKIKANLFVDNYPHIPLYYNTKGGAWVKWTSNVRKLKKHLYSEVLNDTDSQSITSPEKEKKAKVRDTIR